MPKTELLLQRLDEIGKSLERKGGVLLLLGVGSVGIELERMDEFSDLDFFFIVKPGEKGGYTHKSDWLEEVHPLAYSFRNANVGYKVLFEDGLYGRSDRVELDLPSNEALTNLYVGVGRYARGERLSATRFVQSYAVDNILSVLHLLEQEVDYFPDPFGNERRMEQKYPATITCRNKQRGEEPYHKSGRNVWQGSAVNVRK